MDILKTAKEIGLFETAMNLSKVAESPDIMEKAGETLPLPPNDMAKRIQKAARWLQSFSKQKLMFLTPEIALIEEMSSQGMDTEAMILIPCDLDNDAKERLMANLPHGMKVEVLEEPYFPDGFYPGNGIMVTCGYLAGGRTMVMQDTYRMAEHYAGFLGKKVFVPYAELETSVRYPGWMELGQQRISEKWRYGDE